MTNKFRNKYRIPSARTQNWDYGSNGAYFITICTADRICFFGEVKNGEMELNDSGRIAQNIWNLIPQQFPYAGLGDFVIMPNHIHGILVIDKLVDPMVDSSTEVETRLIASLPSSPIASQQSSPSPKTPGGITGDKNPMNHENISRIIRWYKGRCTFEIRKTNATFGWQSRFYDEIIRNGESFDRISEYIIHNPKNWNTDKNNK
jgi:REP element-mobilizing transposase RayT